jgi:hypothetical protein
MSRGRLRELLLKAATSKRDLSNSAAFTLNTSPLICATAATAMAMSEMATCIEPGSRPGGRGHAPGAGHLRDKVEGLISHTLVLTEALVGVISAAQCARKLRPKPRRPQ